LPDESPQKSTADTGWHIAPGFRVNVSSTLTYLGFERGFSGSNANQADMSPAGMFLTFQKTTMFCLMSIYETYELG
jgi:hypothetical protein